MTQRFCEPYDFLFAPYAAMLEKLGLPVLRIERIRSNDTRSFETALEAFSDVLRGA